MSFKNCSKEEVRETIKGLKNDGYSIVSIMYHDNEATIYYNFGASWR